MRYQNICKGRFLRRPNRFIAIVEIEGKENTCHVKNTGRCRELLVEGATVFLEDCGNNPNRKTRYDLIAVYKDDMLVNIDSQAPNKVVGEYLSILFPDIIKARPETKYQNSRFDFYVETELEKIFLEVKGVTLEENGVARFPDAPTERGIKHMQELIACRKEGYDAYIIFVIQMEGMKLFEPNIATHPAFGKVLKEAEDAGVKIRCLGCTVEPDRLQISYEIPYRFQSPDASSTGDG